MANNGALLDTVVCMGPGELNVLAWHCYEGDDEVERERLRGSPEAALGAFPDAFYVLHEALVDVMLCLNSTCVPACTFVAWGVAGALHLLG